MSIKLSSVHTSDSIARPMPGTRLGDADLVFVQRALADIAEAWSVELETDCSDDAILLIIPDGGDDRVGPSFMICREAYAFRLCQVHWDVLREVGVFASLNGATDALSKCLGLHLAGQRRLLPVWTDNRTDRLANLT